ncbi:hypothetical protein [Nitrospirillum sp. BR 11828]|uniref:phosphorylase family protein n=1 Tax=Nitrospirillum sp. BR 11828 TaxID=3104325 RepID=UPI002ACA7A1E|nr:hypothetical protein [Nitrospirillum sp. BR 11828]MDZ5650450.1 hypothetical protein [Nitrospirillum sp. BR 11828]
MGQAQRRVMARPIIVVTGLKREADIARARGWLPLVSAGDLERTERELTAHAPGACGFLSFGLAGGLQPGLAPGTLVIANRIVTDGGDFLPDAAWTTGLADALPHAMVAPVAGQERIINNVAGKQALYAATGAAVVDTESQIAARVGARFGVPVAVLRAVCDPAHMTLPDAAMAPLKRNGTPDPFRILASLWRQPGQIPQLMRLARDSEAAFKALLGGFAGVARADVSQRLLDMT